MRITSRRRLIKKTFQKINLKKFFCLLFVFVFMAGCASAYKKPAFKRLPKKPVEIEKEKVPETGAQKEIIRSEPRPLAVNATPQARASTKLVEDGKKHLAENNFQAAERSFEEAINIDPNNGIAYYYLAKSKYQLALYVQANGVLDKAEVLLAGSDEWMQEVAKLRELIKAGLSD